MSDNTHNLDTSIFDVVTATISDPAAGADFVFTAPARQRIEILSVCFLFTASAAGASRRISLEGADSVGIYVTLPIDISVTANQTPEICYAVGVARAQHGASLNISMPLMQQLILREGDTLSSDTTSIQVADQISGVFLRYKRWHLTG